MNFEDKKILFMGDSITALGGWVADFKQIIKPRKAVNIAVCGARLQDYENTVYDGAPILNGPDNNVNNTLCNQLEKLLRGKDPLNKYFKRNPDYDDFDIIIVAAGTNDEDVKGLYDSRDAVIKAQFQDENGKALALEKVSSKTWPGAMRIIFENLKRLYPNADIFFCAPIQGAEEVRPYLSIKAKGEFMSEICHRISDVNFINTALCGICGIYEKWDENRRDLIDGLHPNRQGEIKIARYNARAIKEFYI